jgi:hypothetical protein
LATDVWVGISKIVAIGDIHGDYKNYRRGLREAGLINCRGNWIVGDAHLAQLGHLADRGPNTNKAIKHMMKLQRKAQAQGAQCMPLLAIMKP